MVRSFVAVAALLVASPLAAQTATAPAAAPSAEAEALGRRVAETGTLASLFPMLIAQDTEELVKQHDELDDAGKARLRAVASATAKAAMDRLLGTMGHEYAVRMSLADLKALVAFNEGPAAKAWRAAEPQVIIATKQTIDGFDLKKESWTAYCRSPGVTCPVPAAE